ncbi:unnamed protein product [Schistocephalus solidus]|uniref:Uncharacterized protein n=1 Tax=Schistocephalus solidus TaxID=70667 RepID=A0A3P7E717_SCHSO|nr:unnamed protein product [Schistocephalus solidus]
MKSELHLGDDEAVICPTIGIADHLGYQHILSISPPAENIVQQLLAPLPRVHSRGLPPRRKAEEGVGQQETEFRTRSQKEETVILTATETMGTQHSLPGSVVRSDAGFEVTKDNKLVHLRQSHQEDMQILVECVLRRIRARHWGSVGALQQAPAVGPLHANRLEKRCPPPSKSSDKVETRWCQLRNVIQSTAFEVLGRARRQNQDWFDDNDADISNLLAEKNPLHKAYMDPRTDTTKAAFLRYRRLVQQRLREMQDAWMIRKAEEIQGSDGTTLLTEKSQILKRWAEPFRSVFNCSSAISGAAIDRLPQVDTNNDLDLPPSLTETIRAVQQISSDEAPTSTPKKAPSNQITEKRENLHAPDNNATEETRWCQLRNVIQSQPSDAHAANTILV